MNNDTLKVMLALKELNAYDVPPTAAKVAGRVLLSSVYAANILHALCEENLAERAGVSFSGARTYRLTDAGEHALGEASQP